MIGGISGAGIGYYNPYTLGYQRPAYPDGQAVQKPAFAMVRNTRPAASPEIPVQPVRPAPAVTSGAANPQSLPIIREGADPVEMAVRMRIQYPDSQNAAQASAAAGPEGQLPPLRQGADLPRNVLPDDQAEAGQAENAQAAKSAQEVFEEGECQTCKERKYQDGSDDPGVSFKTPTSVAPSQAPRDGARHPGAGQGPAGGSEGSQPKRHLPHRHLPGVRQDIRFRRHHPHRHQGQQ